MRIRNLFFRSLLLVALVLFPLYLFGVIPILDSRFQPSASPAYQPVAGDSFNHYIEQNRRRIRSALETHFYSKVEWPFGPGYPIEKVVQMRSPFELPPDQSQCGPAADSPRKGFLLVHGLTDSPYLLSEFAGSLKLKFPCSTVRSVLVPGHGTVPGDLLNVRLEDWQQTVAFGVESFESQVDDLYMVGYSNGAPLAIDYLQENPHDTLISGFILLSPGLEAAQSSISMAPWLKYLLRWVSRGEDTDAVKYDSMPTNAAALFYQVTNQVSNSQPLERPVFMALSGDDTTVNPDFSVEFFCSRVNSGKRKLIWYRSQATGSTPAETCDGVEIVDVALSEPRFISHSHVSISMPAANDHYGLDGNYAACSAYLDDQQTYSDCRDDNANTLYGENTLRDDNRLYQGKLVRRATFNPYYDEMVDAVSCFVDDNCAN